MTALPHIDEPDRPEGYAVAAAELLQAGRESDAEAVLRDGVRRLPDNEWLATDLGNLLNRQGRWAEAADEWRRQLDRFPEHPPAYGGLGGALSGLGQGEAALEVLLAGVTRCPGVDWLRFQYAHETARVHRDPRRTADVWSGIAADFPDLPYPVLEQADALRAAGDPEAALTALRPGLRRWPQNARVRASVLEILLDLGRTDEALAEWRALRALEGDDGRTTPFDQTWRLYIALLDAPARVELLSYLLLEPDTGGADWRPLIVERVQVLPYGDFSAQVRSDIRDFLREDFARGRGGLLHRLLWSLVGGEITAADAADNLRTALDRGPWFMQVLLEHWAHRERRPVYAAAVRQLLPRDVEAELSAADPRRDRVLEALKIASVLDEDTFVALLSRCAEGFGPGVQPAPGSAAAAVAGVVRAHARSPGRAPAAERPLRIAMCVSGQMRGYRDAFATWSRLGLDRHETHYFVHTWKRQGGKAPEYAHGFRTFEPAFAAAYTDATGRLGDKAMARRYPRLLQRILTGYEADVDAAHVRSLYGAAEVRIDDEADAMFEGKSNTWKMHYKISEAHKLALASGMAFDLIVRTRPDRDVVSDGVDWGAVAARCAREHVIFADEGRFIQSLVGYYMGDQFAVGVAEDMDAYAGVFDFVEEGGVFGVPTDHVPHGSLALKTFHSGVRVEPVPGLSFGEHRNASRIPPQEVLLLLKADIAERNQDDIDTLLLDICNAARPDGLTMSLEQGPAPANPTSHETPGPYLAEVEALLADGRTEAAEARLHEAMARFPDQWTATAYGNFLNRQGRWAEAADEWRRQLVLFPRHAPAFGGLATALDGLGQPDAAYDALREGVARCPEVSWLRVQQAHYVQATRGDLHEAAGLWAAMAADFPDLPYPVSEQARAIRGAGDPAAALETVERGLRRWPEDVGLRVTALETLLELGRAGEALEQWRALRRVQADQARAVPYDQAWRLYAALENDPDRREPLAYLMAEPEAPGDWRPLVVEMVRCLEYGHFADWVSRDVLEALPAAANQRTLLQRMLWSVLGRRIEAGEAEANIRDALDRGAWATQVLLHNWSNPERTPAFAEAARRVLPAEVAAQIAATPPRYEVMLQALKVASAFDEPTFQSLLAQCAEHFAERPLGHVHAAAVERVVRAHRRRPAAPPVIPRRLRIAVCVSGQMRGYRDAFPSWRRLGLEAHDVGYFVHTWTRLGGRPPGVTHAYRSFEARFAEAYVAAAARLGAETMERRYPSLVGRATHGDQTALEAGDLHAFYGAGAVGIDDEADPAFAGKSNTWKMHYKIREAHRLALDSGEGWDLFIRIRPDREILSADGVDWRRIHQRAAAERLIYVDEPKAIHVAAEYAMGDQFAVGERAGMDVYAGAFDLVEAGPRFGVPPQHVAHQTVALAAFHGGVAAELMRDIRFGAHVNASKIPDAEAHALLQQDVAGRTPDDVDALLLRSCGSGQGAP